MGYDQLAERVRIRDTMQISLLFWILMLLWAIFGVAPTFPRGENVTYWGFAGSLLLFVLIGLLGWQVFGAAVHR